MENKVKKRADKLAVVFLIIPLVLSCLSAVCFAGGCFLEVPTSRGVIYTMLILGAFILFGLRIFPGVIFAIIGTVRAGKAKKIPLLILGIIEVLGSVTGFVVVLLVIFVGGRSV